ncbi:MAG: RagB/SusD family nutrient uptake outer membrane protein [Bacteroidia bacterium]|nr:RagB/SusD family nutrient uptake outer membrane protein [Bacteroidia bacterium]
MKTKIILLLGGIFALFSACTKYLDPYPNGDRSDETLFQYQDMVQGLVGQCYDNMPRLYSDNEGAYLDMATDDAVSTSPTHAMRRLAVGSLTTGTDPFATYWDRDYKSIKQVNMFLKGRRGFNTKFIIVPRLDSLVRYRLQGEAFALRAWFYWDLLQKFGGKSISGKMLGIPLTLEPIDINTEINLPRDTYDDCVKQIIADCDSALKYFNPPKLPSFMAHRDFLVPIASDRVYAGGRYWGKLDGITMIALKSNVYLTWASPLFNSGNVVARWDSAAVNAKKVMDFKLKVDNVSGGFTTAKVVNWTDPNSPEIVYSARFTASNDAMERMFYPGGFQGNGVIGATQELVNAFPMKNSYPITDSRSLYSATDPYANRDPRFYSLIFYNAAQVKRITTNALMYTIESNANGGKDAAGVKPTNSLTNYYIKKYVYMGTNWADASIQRASHVKMFIRWSHMVLNFAEAANKVVGPTDAAKYGLSAKTAIQYLRTRNTYDNATLYTVANDLYLNEVSLDAVKFDDFIKNERRIETCFEGTRFFDMRRWSTNLTDLNKAVHMAEIQKNTDGTYTYNLNKEAEVRAFKSAYLPIPYNDILRMSKLEQNAGWEAWK